MLSKSLFVAGVLAMSTASFATRPFVTAATCEEVSEKVVLATLEQLGIEAEIHSIEQLTEKRTYEVLYFVPALNAEDLRTATVTVEPHYSECRALSISF